MDQHYAKAASVRPFSTRFLPSDGIPEYNALLDNHLGKRREFLLGNRHALELMQQTGVVERVETQPDNPNQYVVHIAEKPIYRRKRLPPRSRSGPLQLPESQTMPWRQPRSLVEGYAGPTSDSLSTAKKANAATLKGLSRAFSSNPILTTSCKPVLKSAAVNRLALFGSTKCTALLEFSGVTTGNSFHCAVSEVPSFHVDEQRPRSRSTVPVISTLTVNEIKPKGALPKRSTSSTATTIAIHPTKGTVEHLLESDATFMTQIRVMKEQLVELETKKADLDTEIGLLRRKLRGVNAVRENDVAVAHCSSIMQHRLSKAEEEFMKLVKQQQEVKKDVDRVRRELLSLRKVRHKLQEDIEEVAQANQVYEEKVYASKMVRNQLSEELSELERRAEVDLEAQKLNLPPEDAVIVDVAKLMGAVQERNSARRDAIVGLTETGSSGRALTRLQFNTVKPSTRSGVGGEKASTSPDGNKTSQFNTLLDYCTAFRVVQNSMGFPDLAAFEQQFATIEEQLLSKYKANLALADEVAALEKELASVTTDKKRNRANVRGVMHANEKVEHDMQVRVQTTLASIRSYNELREQRNREHAKLRGIMLRCLDALQIDVRDSELPKADVNNGPGGNLSTTGSTGSSTHALYWTETPSPELLEMLQRKMTQVAVTLKVKHSCRILELPPEALRLNRGHDGRRSNMFSNREASKIVLGPREPSGSALAAILGTVQPPSVENAAALTENVSLTEVLHGLHRAISPARRKASSLSLISPELVRLEGSRGSTSSGNSTVPSTRVTPSALTPVQGISSRYSLAAMTEADKEDEEEESELLDGHEETENDGTDDDDLNI